MDCIAIRSGALRVRIGDGSERPLENPQPTPVGRGQIGTYGMSVRTVLEIDEWCVLSSRRSAARPQLLHLPAAKQGVDGMLRAGVVITPQMAVDPLHEGGIGVTGPACDRETIDCCRDTGNRRCSSRVE